MKRADKKPATIDGYIASFPEPARGMLVRIREIVRELAPEAEERFGYGVPAFFRNGNLVYYAAFAKHIGFFPGANEVAAFEAELAKFKHTKGTIQFPLDQPLPEALIRRIVTYKLRENAKKENATAERTRRGRRASRPPKGERHG